MLDLRENERRGWDISLNIAVVEQEIEEESTYYSVTPEQLFVKH